MTNPIRPVALVGLPGVGKTSIGRRLARLLEVSFADTDRTIEERQGCTVAELFERRGEAEFRSIESVVLADLLGAGTGVVATGGGIVRADANRDRLRSAATVVYLQSPVAALVGRLRHDTRRPLLQGGDLTATLQRLHAERDPLYREVATHVVDTAGSTAPRLALRIADLLHGGFAPGQSVP